MADAVREREIIRLESVSSTNDFLKEGLTSFPDRQAVVADEQTSGRGRLGRSWASPRGGLYASILLKPPPPPEMASRVALLSADILCGILGQSGIEARIKWPNDVLVDDRKIAGILPEYGTGPMPWFILGVGMNLASVPGIADGRGLAPAAWYEFGAPPAPPDLFDTFLDSLDEAWPDRMADPLLNRLDSISTRLWMVGRRVLVARGDDILEGVVSGIAEDGRLVLSGSGGESVIDSGELRQV